MDSDIDKKKYYACEDTEDEDKPHPPSRRPSISQPPSPEFFAISSEDENDVSNGRHIMEVDKKALFPPVGPGHCQELHPFIFIWWEENLTQKFSIHPYHRDVGAVWL